MRRGWTLSGEKHTHKHAQEWNGYQILHDVLGINFLRTDSEFGLDIGGMELINQTGLRKQYMQDKQKKSRSRMLLINVL